MRCRNVRVVEASRFYHFGSVSTGRIRHNKGGRIFVMKWGLTQQQFWHNYLGMLHFPSIDKPAEQRAKSFPRATLLGRLRRLGYSLCNYPLGGIKHWDTSPGYDISNKTPKVSPRTTE